MASLRAFVAILPPPEAVQPVAAALGPARVRWPRLSWVLPERCHVTLAFLGDVSDAAIGRLGRRLATVAADTPPFSVRLSGVGAFPRVLWAGIDGDLAGLDLLARAVRVAAQRSRITVDPALFRAHLTLARSRRGPVPADAVAALAELTGSTWPVDAISLVRSHLGPSPRYEILRRYPLGRV